MDFEKESILAASRFHSVRTLSSVANQRLIGVGGEKGGDKNVSLYLCINRRTSYERGRNDAKRAADNG